MSEERNIHVCKNCGKHAPETYCQYCGEMTHYKRITFTDTLAQFLSASFSLEGRLLSTVAMMVRNPGRLFKDYISGKRRPYYKPVAFFMVLTAVYILIRLLLNYDPLEGQMLEVQAPEHAEVQNNAKRAARFMVSNINYIMFFLVFAIGLAMKLFYWKRYNLAEYTTMGFYMSGIYVITGLLFMLSSAFFSFHANQIQLLLLFIIITYSTASLIGKRSIGHLLKYGLVGMIAIFLYVLLGYSFSFVVVTLSNS